MTFHNPYCAGCDVCDELNGYPKPYCPDCNTSYFSSSSCNCLEEIPDFDHSIEDETACLEKGLETEAKIPYVQSIHDPFANEPDLAGKLLPSEKRKC